ncbi:hypothetical protein [Streptomyces sp. NPDC097619]|uniref:hypothetical protein n=1 Tax=Streptomyces sp. NPDC097619 TaxID=3157228 RepID=UPI003327EFE2
MLVRGRARAAGPRTCTTGGAAVPASPPPALELLVHGVAGATPEELLGDPRTVRVTGDTTAAVFRRAEDADAEDRPERDPGPPIPEAYCWSRLTSGNGARALWLLLLPFMVVNLAHWNRPAAAASTRTVRLYGVLVRLVALSLTVLLVAAACEVALDLVAWQCAGDARCAAARGPLELLGPGSAPAQPGRRLALAALVPAALTGLLWYLAHRTWSAYESQPPPQAAPPAAEGPALAPVPDPAPGATAPEPDGKSAPGRAPGAVRGADSDPAPEEDRDLGADPLGRPGFWYGRRLVARLRAAHTAAGLLTVAAAVSVPTAARDRRAAPGSTLDAAGWVIQGLLAAAALAVVVVVCRRGRAERRPDPARDLALTRALTAGALALLLIAAGYAAWDRPDWRSAGRLPGDAVFGLLVLLQAVLVLGSAVTAARLHRRAPDPRAALRGLGGPAVAMLACALGGVMSGGVARWVADRLDDGAGAGAPLPGPPVLLSWQAAVLPPLAVVLLLLAAGFAVRGLALRRRLTAGIAAEYPGQGVDPARSRSVAGARAAATLTDAVPWLAAAVAVLSLVLGAAAVAGAWLTGRVPGEAARGSHPLLTAAAEAAQDAGSWLTGFAFLLFVTWGRRAYRDPAARRTVGILWDVGTFWPRAAHPFAPPCYAERAVPDLTWRITTWTARTGGRVVLSGHSQGSVLAAAAVRQLPPEVRARVALLTHGSPLARLYGRWFPAYFGPEPLSALHRDLVCWRNLWRDTDPIGGPVLGAADDVDLGPLKDPLAYGRTAEHPLPAPLLGHEDYQADPVFAAERQALLARLDSVSGGPVGLPGPRLSPAPGPPSAPGAAAGPPGTTG